jgi:hypothetical protein
MVTESYEAFALEIGDIVVRGNDLYVIFDIEIEGDEYCIHLRDEEGFARHLLLGEFDKVRVLVIDHNEYA